MDVKKFKELAEEFAGMYCDHSCRTCVEVDEERLWPDDELISGTIYYTDSFAKETYELTICLNDDRDDIVFNPADDSYYETTEDELYRLLFIDASCRMQEKNKTINTLTTQLAAEKEKNVVAREALAEIYEVSGPCLCQTIGGRCILCLFVPQSEVDAIVAEKVRVVKKSCKSHSRDILRRIANATPDEVVKLLDRSISYYNNSINKLQEVPDDKRG